MFRSTSNTSRPPAFGQDHEIHIEGYKKKRIAEGVTIRLNRELVAFGLCFYHCIELEKFDGPNPLKKIKLPFLEKDQRDEEPRYLNGEEQTGLIDASNEPLKTIVIAGLNGGFRAVAELLPLRWSSVDYEKREIVVESNYSKNHRRRSVAMNSVLYQAMLDHWSDQRTGNQTIMFLFLDEERPSSRFGPSSKQPAGGQASEMTSARIHSDTPGLQRSSGLASTLRHFGG